VTLDYKVLMGLSDISGPNTQAVTGTDYYVGPRDYSTCATWCKTMCSIRQQEN
jgi:hypothetical protein